MTYCISYALLLKQLLNTFDHFSSPNIFDNRQNPHNKNYLASLGFLLRFEHVEYPLLLNTLLPLIFFSEEVEEADIYSEGVY